MKITIIKYTCELCQSIYWIAKGKNTKTPQLCPSCGSRVLCRKNNTKQVIEVKP